MKRRFIGLGDDLRDDDVVVVRGGPLDPEMLRVDAFAQSRRLRKVDSANGAGGRECQHIESHHRCLLCQFVETCIAQREDRDAEDFRLEPTDAILVTSTLRSTTS